MCASRAPPVLVEGWRPEQSRSIRTKLVLHFSSRRRSGGGECQVELLPGEPPRASVHFRSAEVRERVLDRKQHEIEVEKEIVVLRLRSDPSLSNLGDGFGDDRDPGATSLDPDGGTEAPGNNSQTCTVLMENVAVAMSTDLLSALVESVTSVDEDQIRLERIWESGKAVVTFSSPTDAERFLGSSPTSARLKKHGLSVCPLEAPTSIRVERLPLAAIADLLELYFEAKWASPDKITMIPEEQAAIVTFTDPQVVKSICENRDLLMKSFPVRVYPYYQSLGTALYGPERPTWKLPEALVEPIHPVIWRFLQMKKLTKSLNDQMQPFFCSADMDNANVKLSPLPGFLRQKGLTANQVDNWARMVQDAFHKLMSQYAAFECEVSPSAWQLTEKEVRAVLMEDAIPVFDNPRQMLVIAGCLEDIKRIRPSVENIARKATSHIDRQTNSISEKVALSPPWFYILKQEGLPRAILDVSPEMTSSYNDTTQLLVITGLAAEVYKTTTWIHERIANMRKKQLTLSPSLLEFLSGVDPTDMSQDLFTSQGISAVFTIDNGSVLLLGGSHQVLAEAESKMTTVLFMQHLVVEDREVLKLQGWVDLIRQLLDTYNSTKKTTLSIQTRDTVTVAGFLVPVKEASLSLGQFITNYSQVKETVYVKSRAVSRFISKMKSGDWSSMATDNGVSVSFDPERPRIVLAGARLHVQKARSCFRELIRSLYADTLTIDKPGAKKYFQSTGGMLLSTIMTELGCMVVLGAEGHDEEEDDSEDENMACYCKVWTASGVLVSVSEADICSFRGDAVVNAANEELKHIGGVALALLNAAGPQLQKVSNDFIAQNGFLRPGDAVLTASFNLPCRSVIHAVGPRYCDFDSKTSVSLLKTAVKESLKQADTASCSSVALPAISSGIFGFPSDLCAKTIAQAVREFCDQPQGPQSLTEIHLVDNNTNTVTVLAKAVNQEFSDLDPIVTIHSRNTDANAAGHLWGRVRGRGQSQSQHCSEHGGRGAGSPGRRGQTTMESGGSLKMEHTTAEGLRMVLLKGNIQDQKTEVIVNTISENLNLNQGAVSKALLEAAGSRLQKAVRDRAGASTLQYGDVVVTGGFKLACHKVFHAICPFWNNGGGREEEDLITIIRWCLEEAEKLRMASLSFPALGTGSLSFPRSLVSRVLLEEIVSFSHRRSPRHLRDVVVVVHPGDGRTVDSFVSEFYAHAGTSSLQQEVSGGTQSHAQAGLSQSQQATASFSQVSSPSLGVYQMKLCQLTLKVSSGDITKVASDVIVNSSNHKFTLKTGVSKAILDGAGQTVEMECALYVSSPNFQPNTMLLTSAGKLPSKNILHVVGQSDPQSIKDIVFSVLKYCEDQKFNSVSFPALGTGQGGAMPSAVAGAMMDAVVDFVKKKHPQFVHSVQILIFQPTMMADFHQSMMKRQGEEAESKSVFTKLKDTLASMFHGTRDESKVLVLETEEFESTVFQLCADSHQVVRQAKDRIEKLIVDEHAKRSIRDSYIRHLSQEHLDQLKTLQRELTISIRLEKGLGDLEPQIHLEGLTRDVLVAESHIRNILRQVERTENLKSKALLTSELVQWQYQDSKGTMVDLDIYNNLSLEEALAAKCTVEIKINKVKFTADLQLKKAISHNKQREVKLLRKELKDALPSHWDAMKSDDMVKLFPVTPGSQEFSEVEQEVKRTGLALNIQSIERVQNKTLWQSYQLLKKHLDQKNKNTNNERLLFHGTTSNSVDLINEKGFNRSYAGIHGAMYGNGSYFAVDPAYSAKGYTKLDSRGLRHMYQARVLVGEYTQGQQGLVTPPHKSGSVTNLYDSVTNDVSSPTMFVVFNDIQAYPEYLITFT